MAHQIHDLGSTQTYTEDDVFDVNVGSDSSHNSKTSGNKYNLSEQQSYNRDKSIYSKYDGMLAAYFAGNRDATESEKRTWQTKMKQLREKWERKGRDFPHFPNEDRQLLSVFSAESALLYFCGMIKHFFMYAVSINLEVSGKTWLKC